MSVARGSVGIAGSVLALTLLAGCQQSEPTRPATPADAPPRTATAPADLDRDGSITVEEWDAYGDALFTEIDVDRSGDLTAVELQTGEARVRDVPGQKLDPVLLERWSVRSDTDASGRLSRAEWQAARREAYARALRDQPGTRTGRVDSANPILVITF